MKIIYYEFKMDLLRTFRYKMGIITDITVFTVLLCLFFSQIQELLFRIDFK